MLKFHIWFVALLFVAGSPLCAQNLEFNRVSGVNPDTDGAIDGWSVADQFNGQAYSGYVGELSLIFANSGDYPANFGEARGAFTADAGGSYSGIPGLVVFCIDSTSPFDTSSFPGDSSFYQPMNLQGANQRFLAEGVEGYLNGGLLRAAYLLETFYDIAHNGSDAEAAALQAAIWEVLTDITPDLSPNSGNYFLRTESEQASPLLAQRTAQMLAITDAWFAAAEADDWGGPSYDPGDRVAFWLDPNDVNEQQSVISLNPASSGITLVPEPSVMYLVFLGFLAALRRARR